MPLETVELHVLHRERPELPDIDFDTQASKKDQLVDAVESYIKGFNGSVVRIATFGTQTSKAAIQTAARGLGYEPETGLFLSSLIPVERGQPRGLKEVYYGDKEKKLAPVSAFVKETEEYKDIWKVAQKIEGLIGRRGLHSCGIIISNDSLEKYNGYMRAPNGMLCSQLNLGDSEQVGCIKYDFLVTSALDKQAVTLQLLLEHGYIDWQGTLRKTFMKYFGPDNLEKKNIDMWEMACEGKIISLFQMDSPAGAQVMKQIQPRNLLELAQANNLMRLMPEGRPITPAEEFIEYKKNMDKFFDEINRLKPKKEEREALLKILEPLKGVADSQESIMLLTMEPALTNFSVGEANTLRKTVAKKITRKIDEMKEFFYKKGRENYCSSSVLDYVWNVQIARQLG